MKVKKQFRFAAMSNRNKLWAIDDVDPRGNIGMTVLLAKDKEEAIAKFTKMHDGFLAITEIDSCLALSFSMHEPKGCGAGYRLRKAITESEDLAQRQQRGAGRSGSSDTLLPAKKGA